MKTIHIFGSGISGASLARMFADNDYEVFVYEKESFIGGNCYDYYDDSGVLIHKYGPHIFHTSYEDVYEFINRFCKLNNFVNRVLVNVEDKLVPMPINFKSIELMFPKESKEIISVLQQQFKNEKTISLFDLEKIQNPNVKTFTKYIFDNVYANYTSKMWGISVEEIDKNVINRVKITLGYEDSYFPLDKYQGLPTEGYTALIKNILDHKNIKVELDASLSVLKIKDNKTYIKDKLVRDPIFYCGEIDKFFEYKHGMLPYRSLDIKFETINKSSFQETAVVNYPADPIMTRIAEYKKMTLQEIDGITTISREYPNKYNPTSKIFDKPFYPINNDLTKQIYDKYLQEISNIKNFKLLGRLAQYKYYDMDDAIKNAIDIFNQFKFN